MKIRINELATMQGHSKAKGVRFVLSLYFCVMLFANINAQIPVGKPLRDSPWKSDSLFACAEIAVKDSLVPVEVEWKLTKHSQYLCELYFLPAKQTDSLKFLFFNKMERFPESPKNVSLGRFPKGTKLYFMYIVKDRNARLFNNKLFSGPNNPGSSTFVSDASNGDFKNCWAVVGQKDDSTVEIGFEEDCNQAFYSIIFDIKGVSILK